MFAGYGKRMLGIVLPAVLLGFSAISMASTRTGTNPARIEQTTFEFD
jgi:hypothetical protein